jgi:hypothetical protein
MTRDTLNLTLFVVAICIVLACISKDILLLNEEILVAVCFVSFVVFLARFFSQTLYDTLTSTVDLQSYLQSQKTHLAEWFNYYSVRSTHLQSSLKMIGESCTFHIVSKIVDMTQAQKTTLAHQLLSQFKTVSSARENYRDQLQAEIVRRFQNQLRFAGLRKIQRQLVRHSIFLLKNRKQRCT